ncbi:MAG: hypothetical protein CL908_05905 [Deltaproteobacteria bacterium]|nr:hypothetical protein [Deltaproteobacteria bacterium]
MPRPARSAGRVRTECRDLSSLRVVGIGGATVPADFVRTIEARLGVEFSVLFGQTEASCSITKTRPGDSSEEKAETIGRPMPQTKGMIIRVARALSRRSRGAVARDVGRCRDPDNFTKDRYLLRCPPW